MRLVPKAKNCAAKAAENEVIIMERKTSPCITCTRVKDPRNCENKNCQIWQRWFIHRWDNMRQEVLSSTATADPQPVGVTISGRHYAAPHQVESYLQTDPCLQCQCVKDLCRVPCRLKQNWVLHRKEVLF